MRKADPMSDTKMQYLYRGRDGLVSGDHGLVLRKRRDWKCDEEKKGGKLYYCDATFGAV